MQYKLSRRAVILAGGAGILAELCPLVGSAAARNSPLPVRIGYQAVASWMLLGARKLGLYQKVGLSASFLKFTAGAPMIAAAESNSIDVAMVGTVPFLAGVSQGVDWVAVGLDNEYPKAEGFVARRGSGVKTLADLKGKRIAFFRGSTSHYGVLKALERFHIQKDQVSFLHLDPAQQLAAMINKDIDVAEVWEPWMQKMIHQADGRIIATEASLGIYTGLGVYAVKRNWLAAHGETVRRFLAALLMAYDRLLKDPSPALEVVADEMGISLEEAKAIYREESLPGIYRQTDPAYPYSLAPGSAFGKSMVALARFLLKEHIIPKPVEVAKTLDDSLLKEVLAAKNKGKSVRL